MAEQTSTETKFTVAREGVAITALRPTKQAAQSDLSAIEASMRAAFLEPDVALATVTVTTTVSDPTPYDETPVAVDEPSVADVEPTEVAPTNEADVDATQDPEPTDDETAH
jgi:hypothetical protein